VVARGDDEDVPGRTPGAALVDLDLEAGTATVRQIRTVARYGRDHPDAEDREGCEDDLA